MESRQSARAHERRPAYMRPGQIKDAEPAEIIRAVHNVHSGESQLTPSIARKVLQQFNLLSRDPNGSSEALFDGLTARELIGQLIARLNAAQSKRF